MQSAKLSGAMVRELTVERLRDALRNTFLTMAGLEVAIGPILPREIDQVAEGKLVASLIGWTGTWSATCVLECTPEFACLLSNLLLGTELTQLNEDALNCVAEMSNIVFGNVKTDMEGELGAMSLQIPTVVYGTGIGMSSPAGHFLTLPVQIERHSLRAKIYAFCREGEADPEFRFWSGYPDEGS
jgi:CheY-specific phosphatase CheX